jgi:HAE1 family hydrophobic/amphiphilic exporter-1
MGGVKGKGELFYEGVSHSLCRFHSNQTSAKLNGSPVAALLVYQLPGSNALDVAKEVRGKMDELQKTFPPGLKSQITLNTTNFVTASSHEVLVTLAEAMVLVMLVVFVFLGNWRATLILCLRFRCR